MDKERKVSMKTTHDKELDPEGVKDLFVNIMIAFAIIFILLVFTLGMNIYNSGRIDHLEDVMEVIR